MINKRCPDCQKVLPAKDFYKKKSSPDGLSWFCKRCHCTRYKHLSGGIEKEGEYLDETISGIVCDLSHIDDTLKSYCNNENLLLEYNLKAQRTVFLEVLMKIFEHYRLKKYETKKGVVTLNQGCIKIRFKK